LIEAVQDVSTPKPIAGDEIGSVSASQSFSGVVEMNVTQRKDGFWFMTTSVSFPTADFL
jgi:hypothetical protein